MAFIWFGRIRAVLALGHACACFGFPEFRIRCDIFRALRVLSRAHLQNFPPPRQATAGVISQIYRLDPAVQPPPTNPTLLHLILFTTSNSY